MRRPTAAKKPLKRSQIRSSGLTTSEYGKYGASGTAKRGAQNFLGLPKFRMISYKGSLDKRYNKL